MGQIGAETLFGTKAAAEWLQGAKRDLLLGTAAAADEVAMPLDVRAVPARHAIVQMCVSYIAEILECLEVAVDRRRIDPGMPRAYLARDFLRRRVMTRALERIEHQSALHRHPLSL